MGNLFHSYKNIAFKNRFKSTQGKKCKSPNSHKSVAINTVLITLITFGSPWRRSLSSFSIGYLLIRDVGLASDSMFLCPIKFYVPPGYEKQKREKKRYHIMKKKTHKKYTDDRSLQWKENHCKKTVHYCCGEQSFSCLIVWGACTYSCR